MEPDQQYSQAILPAYFPATTYYVRAYATNSAGTAYGQKSVHNKSGCHPYSYNHCSFINNLTTAVSGGTITADGGGTVTARGVCWSTSANPTISKQ